MSNKDDLLNLDTKKSLKKPLIYGAVAFLIFIIAILGFAIYNNTSSKQDNNVVIPPQIQEDKKESMFKEVPIEETKNDNENVASKPVTKEEKPKPEIKKTEVQNNVPVKEAKTETKPAPAPTAVKKEKVSPKPKENTKQKHPVNKNAKYYIQVAALMKYKQPNKKFLNLIKKEGYQYKLYDTYYVKNGKKIPVVKILIGPFDKKNVRKELAIIKDKITENAFIFKVK